MSPHIFKGPVAWWRVCWLHYVALAISQSLCFPVFKMCITFPALRAGMDAALQAVNGYANTQVLRDGSCSFKPSQQSAICCHQDRGTRVDTEPGDRDVHLEAIKTLCWLSVEYGSCSDCSVWNLIWAPGWAGRRAWKIWHWLISCFTGPTTQTYISQWKPRTCRPLHAMICSPGGEWR